MSVHIGFLGWGFQKDMYILMVTNYTYLLEFFEMEVTDHCNDLQEVILAIYWNVTTFNFLCQEIESIEQNISL